MERFYLEKETLEEQLTAKRYNPATVLEYRDRAGRHRVTLRSGDSDEVSLYREGPVTYVLSQNDALGYVGLEAFEGGERAGEVFLQADHEIESVLGKRGLQLSSTTVVKRLAQHIQ